MKNKLENYVGPLCTVIVVALLFLVNTTANAQGITITVPNGTPVPACADFATDVLKDSWDFSNPEDVPSSIKQQQYQDIREPLSFPSGIFDIFTTGTNPNFSLTSHQSPGSIALPDKVRYGTTFPIDTSVYKQFSVRMYSDKPSFFQVYWSTADTYAITNPVTLSAGEWKTYSLDLSTAALNAFDGTGHQWSANAKDHFRFDPTTESGSVVKIDRILLNKSPELCPQAPISYTASSGATASIYVDDDTNPANGIERRLDATGTGTSATLSTTTAGLAPGNYKVYGFTSRDFSTLRGNPWDMKDSADVDSTRIFNLSGAGFQNNKYCGTTTSTDGNFYLKLPLGDAIPTSAFKHVAVKIDTDSASQVTVSNVSYFDENGTFKGTTIASSYDPTTHIAVFDLSNAAGWTGNIHSLRIQPTKTSSVFVCVDWIALTATAYNDTTEPALPTVASAPSDLQITRDPSASFVQPDNHGGADCFPKVLGHPLTMSSQNDIQGLTNVVNAAFLPYNTVTDSRGNVKVGDFLRANSVIGSDDPKVHPLLFSSSVNANKCVNLCYSLILNRSPEIFHSVARATYLSSSGAGENGDDVINPDRWSESDVCLKMDTLQQEPLIAPGTQHPWRGNINFLSVDPHEDQDGNQFYLDYVELNENHKANPKFSVVVSAPLTTTVSLYYSSATASKQNAINTGATKFATLASGRNSNVYVWDTAGLPDGTYYISGTVAASGSNAIVFHAPLPVIVTHSDSDGVDTTAPIVLVDSPTNGKNVASGLRVAGAAFDDVRLATIELFINGSFVKAITPNLYHKGARDTFPNMAPNSPGFDEFVDISSFPTGTLTVVLMAYDTAGNTTEKTFTIVRGASADPDITYPVPDAAPVPFASQPATLTVMVNDGKNLVFDVHHDGCPSTAIVASKKSDMSGLVTLVNSQGSFNRTAFDVNQWIFGGTVLANDVSFARAKKPLTCKKPKVRVKQCSMKKVPGKKKKVKVCSFVCRNPASTTPPTPTPLPTATPTPQLEDGKLYFQARCNGALPTNTVTIDFSTQISNARQTSFLTTILQELQSKLSS